MPRLSFLQSCFKWEVQRGKGRYHTSRDEDPKTFQDFHEWLYTKVFLPAEKAALERRWEALLKLYVFAEKRIVPRLQNDIIDEMIKMKMQCNFNAVPGLSQAWKNTANSSPLHLFLVDFFARTVVLKRCFYANEQNRKRVPIDFIIDLPTTLDGPVGSDGEKTSGGAKYMWSNRCDYHVHGGQGSPPCCTGGHSSDEAQNTSARK